MLRWKLQWWGALALGAALVGVYLATDSIPALVAGSVLILAVLAADDAAVSS